MGFTHTRKWISSFSTIFVKNVKFINNTTIICVCNESLEVTDLLGNKNQSFEIDEPINYMCIENSRIIVHFKDDIPTIFNSIKIYDTGKLLYESKNYLNILYFITINNMILIFSNQGVDLRNPFDNSYIEVANLGEIFSSIHRLDTLQWHAEGASHFPNGRLLLLKDNSVNIVG